MLVEGKTITSKLSAKELSKMPLFSETVMVQLNAGACCWRALTQLAMLSVSHNY